MATEAYPRQLDLAPPKAWRRFFPAWLRSLIWVDSAGSYDAFLSYSWKSDSEVAPVIQSVLQRFLCPWYKLRAKTVFRDLSCLPAGSSLETELFERLDRSLHLIVLASPESAHSHGMEMEAGHWFSLSRQRNGQVLIIVTAGEPKTWDEIRDHLLPSAVRSNLATEPLWIPLHLRRREILARPNSNEVRGQLIEDLRQVLLCLYPGHDWGQLRGEERSQRRRAIGLMSGLALLFLVLAMAALGFMFDAQRQATIAQRNARESNGRELAAFSTESLIDDPERSILLGMQAVNATLRFGQPPVAASEEALHQAILSSQVRMTLRGHSSAVLGVAFSPDGKRFATASGDQTAKEWDAESGKELLTLRGHSGSVFGVAYSPDGKRLATASGDQTAKVWDAESGKEMLTLSNHSNAVNSVVYSPDSKRLATASDDSTVQVYALDPRELLDLARGRVTRNLTPDECKRYFPSGTCPPLP